jgi:hypothetical protein
LYDPEQFPGTSVLGQKDVRTTGGHQCGVCELCVELKLPVTYWWSSGPTLVANAKSWPRRRAGGAYPGRSFCVYSSRDQTKEQQRRFQVAAKKSVGRSDFHGKPPLKFFLAPGPSAKRHDAVRALVRFEVAPVNG